MVVLMYIPKFNIMKRTLLVGAIALQSLLSLSQHTFSIVAVDPATGEVGSAGASCIGGLVGVDIISGILPGRGGINAQAWVCIPNSNLNNGLNRMDMGDSPQQVLDWLFDNDSCSAHNFDTAYRQYGMVDFDGSNNPRSAAFTGHSADDYKGQVTGSNYSIQGNILLGQQILDSMEARFLSTSGELADKLMAALQGANVPGADTRCLIGGTSSLSSYIKLAKPSDTQGNFYLDIVIKSVPPGVEPIDTLQTRFDAWKNAMGVRNDLSRIAVSVVPNPGHENIVITINTDRKLQLEFFSSTGERLLVESYHAQPMSISTTSLARGLIYYRVVDESTMVKIGSFVVM